MLVSLHNLCYLTKMYTLKVILSKSSVALIKHIKFAKFSKTVVASSKIEPINMSYASYESTDPSDRAAPLIVMHGLLGSKSNWNTICKILHRKTVPRRKIIAVDARNHGDSPHSPFHSYDHMVEDVKALMRQLNFKQVALMGHSMGGRAMMYLALKEPELVDKLIVADMSPVNSEGLSSLPSILIALQKVSLQKGIALAAARRSADKQLSKLVDDEGVRAFFLTNLVKKPDGSYGWRINIQSLLANFHEHIGRFPDVSDLQFTGPVIFIAGGYSDFIQKTDHPKILKMFPNAKFKEIDGAGHWLHSEKPAEYIKICMEFLNKKVTNAE